MKKLLRKNIKELVSYSSARDEFSGSDCTFLDANENPIGSVGGENYNRYPDPYQNELKNKLSKYKNIASNKIFLGNGSDEIIDLLIRAFCEPGEDSILIMPPSYGIYKVAAGINNVKINKAPLTSDFHVDVKSAVASDSKICFLCSPNNPTGHCLKKEDILNIIQNFNGLVVLDEAYIDFCPEQSLIDNDFENLVILQTFSKAWGLAGIRLGVAYTTPEIVKILNKIKPSYNINSYTQEAALKALDRVEEKEKYVQEIVAERKNLAAELENFNFVKKIFASDANFLLIQVESAKDLYQYLLNKKIIVRDRSNEYNCKNCIRITIGTKTENQTLLKELKNYA